MTRVNIWRNDRNWLSLQPRDNRFNFCCKFVSDFGEMLAKDKLNGKGIKIYARGSISIRYHFHGEPAPGNYINMYGGGEFQVGESYLKDRKMFNGGTMYNTDGTSIKFDK